ncbi:MAG: CD20-like domain-containing protein [Bacteroidales bacterium]|jgi:hypothetical protein|nr:CD20-like domain-containing protein [Bacteroidales bacterium]
MINQQQYTNAGRTLGIIAIVFGGVALFLSFTCLGFAAIFPGVVAIVLSILSLNQAKRLNGNKNIGIASLVISVVATVIALVWLSVAGASVFFEEKFEKIKERNGGEFKFEVVTSDEKEEMDEDMEEALKDLEEELKNLEDNNLIDSSTTKIIKRVAKKTAKRVRDKAISDSEKQKVIVITGGEDTIKIKTDIE